MAIKYDIVIDPGHGGYDPGGGTNNLWKEKDMVLKISLEQKRIFEKHGLKVAMTRTKDEYIDSVPRTNRVKASGAKYCISNHINAFNGKAEGAETIHSIYSSSKLAEGILNAIVKEGAKRRRVFSKAGTNGDYYYMHRLTGYVNTIIVEYGFADHSGDARKIDKDWKKYAAAVARYYIEEVFNKKYVDDSKPSTVKPAEKPVAPKPAPKPVKPVSKPKEEDDMLKQAIVIGSLNDYAAAEILSIRKGIPIFPRSAVKGEVAKELIVVGGDKKGLKADKITNLSGGTRFETAENVEKYLKK